MAKATRSKTPQPHLEEEPKGGIHESSIVDELRVKKLTPREPCSFSRDVLGAFYRRQKAIKYRSRTFEIVFGADEEENADGSTEEVQLICINSATMDTPPTRTRLKLWADGELWLWIGRSGPRKQGGWDLNETFRGNVANMEGRKIVERYEAMQKALGTEGSAESDPKATISAIWGHDVVPSAD